MNNQPLVSVLMITYNHEAFISEAIEGVLMQKTNFPIELIIADDASTDKNQSVISNYAGKNTKIKPILRNQNIGPNANWLDAAKQCTGRYIALCEGDDYWTDPLKLQKQVDFLEGNEEYVMCWTRFRTKKEPGSEFSMDNNKRYFAEEPNGVEFDFEKFYRGWHIGMQTLMFKNCVTDLSKAKEWKIFKDVVLITELLNAGKGFCLNNFTAVYRLHEGGIYTGTSQLQRAKDGADVYKEIFLKNRKNQFLKLKYLRFSENYMSELISNKLYFKAFSGILDQFFHSRDFNSMKHNLKKTIQAVFRTGI